jgi:hypothetical protein
MKFKSILLTALATLGLTATTMAQVPNYVPTNGLVGWWPFNGNANDISGNGNNGTPNNVSYTTDRFGSISSSASFPNGNTNSEILIGNQINPIQFSISIWIRATGQRSSGFHSIISKIDQYSNPLPAPNNFEIQVSTPDPTYSVWTGFGGNNQFQPPSPGLGFGQSSSSLNVWNHLVLTFNGSQGVTYLNGTQVTTNSVVNYFNPSSMLCFGNRYNAPNYEFNWWGQLDDIGMWNRVLTQQEISDLYNAVNCFNNTAITPQTNSLTIGNTATFTATTSDPNPSYVWQSNFGQGYQTLNNFGNYSGANSATLNISNVQLSEHNQPIRVITTSGNCIDTSNVAVISILDTCITNVTVYDTLLTTVTDTLVINTQITGINPPNNLNTLKVFPNPASTHITIDYGNFNAMSGYTLTIVNSVGQTVFTTPINQQTSYIGLSTWTGNGIYFVQLIDPQNNTIENRKIVIQ